MFSLVPELEAAGIFSSRLHFVILVAICIISILTPTSSEPNRNVLGGTQQENYPYEQLIAKSREKRQIHSNNTVQDHHKYYTTHYYQDGRHLWTDLRNKPGSVRDEYLSSGERALKVVELSFEFPYYGHFVRNATLTTGGFINLGKSKIRQVAKFQYVAPLMAHFNPSLNTTSTVHHFTDGRLAKKRSKILNACANGVVPVVILTEPFACVNLGNEFIVQWSSVLLHSNSEAGRFTFQCMLNKTGEIVFSYHKIPIPVINISRAVHPVDVGISDAYFVDKLRHYYGIWQIFRTFYTYDAVHINQSWAVDNAAIVLRPKPNCLTARSCEDCIERRRSTEFHCTWCNKLERCSDGFDRQRSEWLSSGCNSSGISQKEKCVTNQEKQIEIEGTPGLAPWIIAVICVSGVVLFVTVAWLVYAFTHPNSKAGLCLIQHGSGSCCRKKKYEDSGPTNSSVFNKVLS